MRTLFIIGLLCVLTYVGWHYYERQRGLRLLNSYSDEIKIAANDAYQKLALVNLTDAQKANVAGQLFGCLDACFKQKGAFSSMRNTQNCESACLCITDGALKAMPIEQVATRNRTDENVNKTIQVWAQCIAQYRN